MKSIVAFILILLLTRPICRAQEDELTPKRTIANLHLGMHMGFPLGDFKKNIDGRVGLGGGFVFSYLPFENVPIGFGASFSYLHFGRSIATINLVPNGPLEIKTAHSFFLLHGVIRFQPKVSKLVRPYVDILLGANFHETRTKENENFLVTIFGEEDPLVLDKKKDSAFSWGGALGLQFIGNASKTLHFDVKIVMLDGGKMEYVPNESVQVVNDELTYEIASSTSDMFVAQVGIVVLIR